MLEGRCHPEMTISGNPGYILRGYSMLNDYVGVRIHDSHTPLTQATPPPPPTLRYSTGRVEAAAAGMPTTEPEATE